MSVAQQLAPSISTLQRLCAEPSFWPSRVLEVSHQYRHILDQAGFPTRPLDAIIEIMTPAMEELIPTRVAAQAVIARLRHHDLYPKTSESSHDFSQRLETMKKLMAYYRSTANLASPLGRLFLKPQQLYDASFRFTGEVPSYADVRPIARTYYSSIFRGTDPFTEDEVALKVFRDDPERDIAPTSFVLNELRFQSAMETYPIVNALDVSCLERGQPYIAYPWISGGDLYTLTQKLKASGIKWSLQQCLATASKMIACVAALHSQRIIHRDIKPENFLVNESYDQLCLTDFSIAIRGDEGTPTNQSLNTVGTPGFIPDEANCIGYIDDYTRDVYALGQSLLQFFRDMLPERLHTRAGRQSLPERKRLRKLRSIMGSATTEDPLYRYTDACEMQNAFDQAFG